MPTIIRIVSRDKGAGNASRTAKSPNLDAFTGPPSPVLDFCLLTLVSRVGPCLCLAGPEHGILRGDEPWSCASDSLMVTAVAWGALLTQAETICRGSPMVRILTDAKWPSMVLDLGTLLIRLRRPQIILSSSPTGQEKNGLERRNGTSSLRRGEMGQSGPQ